MPEEGRHRRQWQLALEMASVQLRESVASRLGPRNGRGSSR